MGTVSRVADETANQEHQERRGKPEGCPRLVRNDISLITSWLAEAVMACVVIQPCSGSDSDEERIIDGVAMRCCTADR